MSESLPPAGWYTNPDAENENIWWDGVQWTEHVRQKANAYDPEHSPIFKSYPDSSDSDGEDHYEAPPAALIGKKIKCVGGDYIQLEPSGLRISKKKIKGDRVIPYTEIGAVWLKRCEWTPGRISICLKSDAGTLGSDAQSARPENTVKFSRHGKQISIVFGFLVRRTRQQAEDTSAAESLERQPIISPSKIPPKITTWISLAVIVLAIIIVIGSSGGSHISESNSTADTGSNNADTSAKAEAQDYVKRNAPTARELKSYVQLMQINVYNFHKTPDPSTAYALAHEANNAHDQIGHLRGWLMANQMTSVSATLKIAQTKIEFGAADLQKFMSKLAKAPLNPSVATSAVSLFKKAQREWNEGVIVLWRIAGRPYPPTI